MVPSRLSRFADGVIEAAWLAAVIFTPVFFNVYSSRIFEPDKISLLRSLALVILLAWLVKIIDQGRVRWDKISRQGSVWKQILHTPLMLPVSLMILSYIISTIFSVSPQTSLWGSYQRLQGTYTFFSYLVIFFSLVGNLRRREQVERLITAIIVASLPVSFYGVLQRFKLDPVPWGGDTSTRVASTLGNSIFVAAYLIMTIPLTVMRFVQSFISLYRKTEPLVIEVIRGSVYVFILALQLVTIYFSGSRGPLLGLLAGLFLMLLLLSLLLGKRWLTYSIILGALLGAGFLVVFNLPNGPLQGLRESQIVGRFGTLLDNQSNTAKVRQYIWEGVVRMLSPHEPLVYPDGTTDTWNFMRLLIGYGPEGMYVAYNPFYSSDLGHVERRNASPDRSHNETWDSLVMTGVFGLVAYLFLFLGLFYYVFSSLNLLKSDLNKRLYWGIAGLSGLVGSLVILIWGGIAYLGVGLPFSLAIGLLIYLMFFALSQKYQRPATDSEMARALLMIALASAVMAHWLEINFGIAIVATRTHFWIYTGLILLLGHVFPRLGDYSKMTATPSLDLASDLAPGLSDRPARTKRKVKESSRKIKVGGPTHWLMNSITVAIPLGMMLVALAYNFITNSNHLQSSTDIIWLSLTRLSAQNSDVSYWLLTMVLVSWLIGGLVWMNEITEVGTWRVWAKSFGLILSFSIAILLLYAYWHASGLSEIASSTVTNLDQLLVQINRLGLLLSRMYIYLFILIIAYGMSIVWVHQRQEHSVNVYAALAGCVGLVLVVFSIQSTNIQVIQADIAFKMAEPFTNQGQWPVATRLYQYSLGLAPSEDHYYLFLGRSYLEQAKEQTEIQQQTLLINNAESDLKRAQRINPLNTDHTANLARLYTWWASSSSDLSQKLERAEKASNYYRLATTLSPNNATLWGEWATLYLEIVGDFAQAKTILDHALSVDSRYNFVYGLLGDYELSISRQLTDQEDRIERISSALEYYERAVEVSVGRDASSKAEYMIMLGNTHIELAVADPTSIERQHILEAIQIFIDILSLNSPSIRVWQLNEQIAQLYLQIDDRNSAEPYLQEALANAPDDQKTRIGDLYAQLYGQP